MTIKSAIWLTLTGYLRCDTGLDLGALATEKGKLKTHFLEQQIDAPSKHNLRGQVAEIIPDTVIHRIDTEEGLDDFINRFLPKTNEETEEFISAMNESYKENAGFFLDVVDKFMPEGASLDVYLSSALEKRVALIGLGKSTFKRQITESEKQMITRIEKAHQAGFEVPLNLRVRLYTDKTKQQGLKPRKGVIGGSMRIKELDSLAQKVAKIAVDYSRWVLIKDGIDQRNTLEQNNCLLIRNLLVTDMLGFRVIYTPDVYEKVKMETMADGRLVLVSSKEQGRLPYKRAKYIAKDKGHLIFLDGHAITFSGLITEQFSTEDHTRFSQRMDANYRQGNIEAAGQENVFIYVGRKYADLYKVIYERTRKLLDRCDMFPIKKEALDYCFLGEEERQRELVRKSDELSRKNNVSSQELDDILIWYAHEINEQLHKGFMSLLDVNPRYFLSKEVSFAWTFDSMLRHTKEFLGKREKQRLMPHYAQGLDNLVSGLYSMSSQGYDISKLLLGLESGWDTGLTMKIEQKLEGVYARAEEGTRLSPLYADFYVLAGIILVDKITALKRPEPDELQQSLFNNSLTDTYMAWQGYFAQLKEKWLKNCQKISPLVSIEVKLNYLEKGYG